MSLQPGIGWPDRLEPWFLPVVVIEWDGRDLVHVEKVLIASPSK
jgi:hypothetical protein